MSCPSPETRSAAVPLAALFAAVVLSACGGGSDAPAPAPPPATLTDAQRSAAATSTANGHSACTSVAPFYWEIGDRSAARVSGSVNVAGNATSYTASTPMSIASASKWLYGAYVVQKRGAAGLSASDIKFLNFRSGYTSFSQCLSGQTVDACVAYQNNSVHSNATDGFFDYGGGHMENHASLAMGLGALANAGLAAELQSQLGSDVAFIYTQPQPAGGVATSAANYTVFLRKLLGGQLRMGATLGSNPVCTNPGTCAQALFSPIPGTESWHYAIGYWVEDDPAVGDGAFSSAGAFGFYPWIDASKTWYGVLARQSIANGEGYDSAVCGRLIRKAWVTGVAL